jgi:hypothetical protein
VQTVRVQYVVEMWVGRAWVPVAVSDHLQAVIGANESGVRFVQPELIVKDVSRGYFRFSLAVVWLSSTGRLLGSAVHLSNVAADHQCVTPARWCISYDGYVRTGGYLSNSW